MTYSSSANPPHLLVPRLGAAPSTGVSGSIGGGLWVYTSTDPLASVVGSSYFSDGVARGLKKYDNVIHNDINTPLTSIVTVTSVTTSAGVTCSSLMTS